MEEYHVAISVTDRGRGVSSEQLPHLFRKVSRFDGEDGEGNGGAGLGLAICRGIVESHGGRIRAESEGEGRGTRVTFTLPTVEEAAMVAGGESEPGSPRRPGGQRPTRILVVDDDPQTPGERPGRLVEGRLRDYCNRRPGGGARSSGGAPPQPGASGPGSAGGRRHRFDAGHLRDFRGAGPLPFRLWPARGDCPGLRRRGGGLRGQALLADRTDGPGSRAALRRGPALSRTEPVEPCTLGDLTIDYVERRVTVGGRGVRLTDLEYRLLVELSIHLGRVVTYGELLERVWERRKPSDQRPLRSAVKSIRRKLGDNPRNPAYIFTEASGRLSHGKH